MRFKVGRIAVISTTALGGMMAFTAPAQAYIDPGTGGMLLQLLLGGVAGALVIGKLYWLKIKERFQAVFGRGAKSHETDDRGSGSGS